MLLGRVYQRLGRLGRIALPVATVAAIVGLLVATSGSTFTFENYRQTFDTSTSDSPDMWQHFINSMAITIPATVIPIAFAAFAAYAFAWMDFKGRDWLFVAVVAMLAVPITIQVYFNSGLAYWLNRRFGEAHCVAGPSALIGASNFFELSVATAVSVFGVHSGAALATVVGVLVEVPVMLSLVAFSNRTRHWFISPEAKPHE